MSKRSFKRYTVTAALPYANGDLHIGHLAGAYLPADIYTRYLRLHEKKVIFICGSDEHGAAITLKARKEHTTPKKIIDKFHTRLKTTFQQFGIAFDIYYRTSEFIHHKTSQDFFKILYEKHVLFQRNSKQYYDEKINQFLADRYITGICPKCSYDKAYGDQCEKCGSSLNPTDLINPKSILSGGNPILENTVHWYLPMDVYQNWIKDWIEKGTLDGKFHHDPKEWRNHVLGQCKSWIASGLQSRAMTRDLEWGVPVPLKSAAGKVLYVWMDAPIGYISATKAWAEKNNESWEPYWKSEDTQLIHFIGKDNIVFHCIIFPILLKAHGEFILPQNIPANEFLNLEKDKLSTSKNWAIWVDEYMRNFPNKQDTLRYVLTSIAPENKDTEFTWKDFQVRNNSELVNILGNFFNRTIVLTHKHFNGEVPSINVLLSYEKHVIEQIKTITKRIEKLIESFHFKEAQFEAISLARLGNKYLAQTEPWKLIKSDKETVKTILNISLQICANLAIILDPFLPHTTKKMRYTLCMDIYNWKKAGRINILKSHNKLRKSELLFEPISNLDIEKQIEKLKKNSIH